MKMKTKNYLLVFALFCSSILLHAQETTETTEKKDSKFSISAIGGLGYATVDSDHSPNYNLNVGSSDILLNYKFYKNIGVSTGAGYSVLTGNGFDAAGSFYHERSLLKIPLNLNFEVYFNDKFSVQARVGAYAQTIVFDEYQYLKGNVEDVYEGWNFGTNIGIDFIYKLKPGLSMGLTFSGQSDFSEFEMNKDFGKDQKQKIINLNTIGYFFRIEL